MEYYIGDILDKIVGSTSIACETNHDVSNGIKRRYVC